MLLTVVAGFYDIYIEALIWLNIPVVTAFIGVHLSLTDVLNPNIGWKNGTMHKVALCGLK